MALEVWLSLGACTVAGLCGGALAAVYRQMSHQKLRHEAVESQLMARCAALERSVQDWRQAGDIYLAQVLNHVGALRRADGQTRRELDRLNQHLAERELEQQANASADAAPRDFADTQPMAWR